jgi:hypothetical protein
MNRLSAAVAAVLALSLAGCGEGDEGHALMEPGSNCLSCHTGGEPVAFTFAGTVYGAGDAAANQGLAGVTVTLTGSGGSDVLVSNAAGNFFTSKNLGSNVRVQLSFGGVSIDRPGHLAGSDGCGRCHSASGSASIRVHVGPNRGSNAACAACHGAT